MLYFVDFKIYIFSHVNISEIMKSCHNWQHSFSFFLDLIVLRGYGIYKDILLKQLLFSRKRETI